MKHRRVYKKQSAVQWMFSQLPDDFRFSDAGFKLMSQAKEIHKEEIQESYDVGYQDSQDGTPQQGDLYYHNYY